MSNDTLHPEIWAMSNNNLKIATLEHTTKLANVYRILEQEDEDYISVYTDGIEQTSYDVRFHDFMECLRLPKTKTLDEIKEIIEIFDIGVHYVKTQMRQHFEVVYDEYYSGKSKKELKGMRKEVAYHMRNYDAYYDKGPEYGEPYELK